MSLQLKAEITGLKELDKALSELPKSLSKSALRSALKQVSKPVVETAQENARKDTGEGAKSIKARSNRKLKPVGVSIGPSKENFHMMFIEFGTMKMPAKPFLRPAWDENKDSIPKKFGEILWPIILKKARALAKKGK